MNIESRVRIGCWKVDTLKVKNFDAERLCCSIDQGSSEGSPFNSLARTNLTSAHLGSNATINELFEIAFMRKVYLLWKYDLIKLWYKERDININFTPKVLITFFDLHQNESKDINEYILWERSYLSVSLTHHKEI